MTRRIGGGIAAALLLAASPGAAKSSEFRWSGHLAAGKTLEIKGVNGSIEAVAASGAAVEVAAEKRASRDDPDAVEIKVVEHADGVTLCAIYPESRRGRPNRCEPGAGGHLSANDNDVDVNFRVRLPAGVNFVGRTVNGSVEGTGLGADVTATTVNGAVRASGGGVVRGETVNGSLFASLGKADWSGDLSYSTVNGSITVELPSEPNAEVEASTVNGGIETDFPLKVSGKWGPKQLRGTLGTGGRSLSLETVNGAIRLKKRP